MLRLARDPPEVSFGTKLLRSAPQDEGSRSFRTGPEGWKRFQAKWIPARVKKRVQFVIWIN